MAKFMAVYTGSLDANRAPPDQQTIADGMAAWSAWMKRHADRIVDTGGPLGKTFPGEGVDVMPCLPVPGA